MEPNWKRYIGIPYVPGGRSEKGADCWGLVHIVLRQEFGIITPELSDVQYWNKDDVQKVATYINQNKTGWVELPKKNGKPDLKKAFTGDALLIRMRNHPIHVALVTWAGHMLHVEEEMDSTITRFTTFEWEKRIVGVYRHESFLTT